MHLNKPDCYYGYEEKYDNELFKHLKELCTLIHHVGQEIAD